jgi:hypothetical protein
MSFIDKFIAGFVLSSFIVLLLSYVSGREKWEASLEAVIETGAASDAEIYCIIASQGFEQLDVFDNPSTIDFIMAGIKDTDSCYCSCIQK